MWRTAVLWSCWVYCSGNEDISDGIGKPDGDDDQYGCGPEADFCDAIRALRGTVTIGAGNLGFPVNTPSSVTNEAQRNRREDWLIWLKSRQVADPRATDASKKQGERQHATTGRPKRRQDAPNRQQRCYIKALSCPDRAWRRR